MMTIFLTFLLALAAAGLVFLGLQVIHLRTRTSHFDAGLEEAEARYREIVEKHNDSAQKWNSISAGLKTEIQRLSKWKNIADADAKAAEMERLAWETLETAKADANSLIDSAQQKAALVKTLADEQAAARLEMANDAANGIALEAREKAKSVKAEAQAILDSAAGQVAKIIENANKRAEEIAGSAYEAMRNASLYENTVKAMKNLIKGYGDEYIIPEQSLLDDLADDFSHTQAGQELKRAREFTKTMIRNGTAASCDYVEANRRETAINFVLDAFNGKVDSILSRTKHDNAGKLDQQIRDAFTLVNYGGKAFRDARITEQYLAARLDELKWAAVAQQLSLEEREQQREIKEQAREEARVAKEYERALREAAKEEEMLQNALQQAQEQFEHASGKQKTMYEERIRDMQIRLEEALERKERVRSMAEQTRKGHVYILSNIGSFGEDVHKIGLTRRDDPYDRVRELGDASVPFGFDVHAMILSDDAPALEGKLHEHFLYNRMNKVNHRKEFFRASLQEIRDAIERLGITTGVKWTMTSEAAQYRETLAIEKKIKDDPALRDAWAKRQLAMDLADELDPVGALIEEE